MGLGSYVVRRLLSTIPLLLVIVTAVFFLLRAVPGGPAVAALGDRATPQAIAAFERQWGLDRPIAVQYLDYLLGLLKGDLGRSFRNGTPIAALIGQALPHSLWLTAAATVVSLLVGLPAGIAAALWPNSRVDGLGRVVALLGLSIPDFYLGILLILLFSLHWGLLPMRGAGDWSNLGDLLLRTILPALTLGLASAAVVMRITRSAMKDVLPSDYVRTARSKGLPESVVLLKHALRNALIPVLSVIGVNMGLILGNAMIVETVFSRPGLGRLLTGSILDRDFAVIQSSLVVYAVCIALVNLLTDIAYALVDPRIRYG